MISPLPYANRIEYHINSKLQTEIPHDLKHDIVSALYDFASRSEERLHNERDYWRDLYIKKVNEK
jgi:hypothetical protein